MIRELTQRCDTFVTVTMLWDDETNETFIEIETDADAELIPVPGDELSQAFQHPFVYAAANSHGHHITV